MVIAQVYAEGFDMIAGQIQEELNVTFNYDMSPPQDAFSKTMLEFASRSSTADLVLFMPANLADYAPHLEPIVPLADRAGVNLRFDDVMPAYRELYSTWDDVVYAVPWDGDQFNLFYNKMAFEHEDNKSAFQSEYGRELRPPQTWEEYLEVAEFFNQRDWDFDGEPEYGVAEAWQRGGYAYWWWWAKFVPLGGIPFDENMNPLINSPAGVKALEITVEAANYAPPGTANFGYPELENALVNGEVPMVVQWSSAGKTAQDPSRSKIVNNVGVAPLPGVRVDGEVRHRYVLPTGWAIGIPKYSDNKEIAMRVVEILSEPENALQIALNPATAVDPWRASSFYAPAWDDLWPGNPGYGARFIEVQRMTVENAVPDLQIPGSDEYTKALDAEISAAIAGTKSVEQALNDAAAEWDNITDRRGRSEQASAWTIQLEAMRAEGIDYEPNWAQ
jgi:multiple sugar transport system substrate-binding protein